MLPLVAEIAHHATPYVCGYIVLALIFHYVLGRDPP